MPLTDGSGSGCGSRSGSCYFQDANKKLMFFNLLLFEGTFTSFSKIKSQKEVKKKQKESRFFLLFLPDDRRIRIQSRINTYGQWIRIRKAQKDVDPVEPDPDHCQNIKLSELSAWVSGGEQGCWVMPQNPCCGPHSTTVALPHLHTLGLNILWTVG
jgi:hypothetical protein